MKKQLEILVTQYKEEDAVVKPLLDSIENQIGVKKENIGVVIVNDGSGVYLSDELLNGYSYDIKYIKAEHGGISKARNNVMDAAEAEYIMFCDCDDMFHSMFGLRKIFSEMNRVHEDTGLIGFDVLVSAFEEEVGEGCIDIEHHDEKDNSFIHGKVYKLNFLKQNNIRWKDDIYCHEDVYFNVIALTESNSTVRLKDSFYLWKYRKGSITRSDNAFELETFPEYIKCGHYLIDELLRRGYVNCAEINSIVFFYRFYLFMNRDCFTGHEEECEKLIKEFWIKYKYLIERAPKAKRIELLLELKKGFYEVGLEFEKITYNDWIKRIEAR